MNQEQSDKTSSERLETTILGGGCFWCTEAIFSRLRGVKNVQPGYAGGLKENPTYQQVCSGTTGHAEVVRLTFDPTAISYREILQIFFSTHDPTTLNRQGLDVGTQYRSLILYQNEEQRATAEEVIKELSKEKVWKSPIVTQLEPLKKFYKAEDYHKDYYERHPDQGYCSLVISPKIAKIQKLYLSKLKM